MNKSRSKPKTIAFGIATYIQTISTIVKKIHGRKKRSNGALYTRKKLGLDLVWSDGYPVELTLLSASFTLPIGQFLRC